MKWNLEPVGNVRPNLEQVLCLNRSITGARFVVGWAINNNIGYQAATKGTGRGEGTHNLYSPHKCLSERPTTSALNKSNHSSYYRVGSLWEVKSVIVYDQGLEGKRIVT